ncbi:hypothetical protein RRG08_017124 [Elysia crispata]|uniref:Uncharacterized protein n=1 Tax=Elysia crispata TaxID=231223 RepID=A0AAE0YDC2_9GAST|nr:hypothetical protein RRG08_017124 [Elysia crispata]
MCRSGPPVMSHRFLFWTCSCSQCGLFERLSSFTARARGKTERKQKRRGWGGKEFGPPEWRRGGPPTVFVSVSRLFPHCSSHWVQFSQDCCLIKPRVNWGHLCNSVSHTLMLVCLAARRFLSALPHGDLSTPSFTEILVRKSASPHEDLRAHCRTETLVHTAARRL